MPLWKGKDVPGPGQYNPNPKVIEEANSNRYFLFLSINVFSFSFGQKPLESFLKPSDIPGPGAYQMRSTFLTSGSGGRIGTAKSRNRISKSFSEVPGPGTYAAPRPITKNTAPKYSFGIGKKGRSYSSFSPGPGTLLILELHFRKLSS
jgi:hypothetical protein